MTSNTISFDNTPENELFDGNISLEHVQSSLESTIHSFKKQERPLISSYFKGCLSEAYSFFKKRLTETVYAAFSDCLPDLSSLAGAARQKLSEWRESFADIVFVSISDQRKQQLLDSYKQWGEYGWTIIPFAKDEKLFDRLPSCKQEADTLASKQCSFQVMNELFQATEQMRYVRKSDFAEAVFDYQNRKYKSCALILSGLIESKLIRLQKKSSLNGKRRDVGEKAGKKAINRAKEKVEDHMIFTLLFQENLFACICKVFENGEDFKKQPDVINRNFLGHGMMTKRVSKKDCIQLFLLYYNTLDLVEFIYK